MKIHSDYTAFARRFSGRYPLISFITIQVNFWILANCFLLTIVWLSRMSIQHDGIGTDISFSQLIVFALISSLVYGICQGLADYFVKPGHYVGYKLLFSMLLNVIAFVISVPASCTPVIYLFSAYILFSFVMNIVLVFINQMNSKYGPGFLIPLLVGKYAKPIEERRIFLFMDMKSSTTLAETMGHMSYSAFLGDSFKDINSLLVHYNAEIYQYVGDEVVLTWKQSGTETDSACINFFFACGRLFKSRSEYYIRKYNAVPDFKAGIHCGIVTVSEVGNVKREIAYHGDILNTAARIQFLCNAYGKKLLASEVFIKKVIMPSNFVIEHLGLIP